MSRRVLSFALNRKGMGHASRLVAVHAVLRELGWSSVFFVGHEHRIISDYGFDQIVIPERTPGDSETAESRKSRIRKAVIREVLSPGDVILHDVVVHPELHELAAAGGCFQGYIYRERKDQADPVPMILATAPAIDTIYVLGQDGDTRIRQGIRVRGVPDVVREGLGDKSVWVDGDEDLRIVVTAGGGGHPDAEPFLNAALAGVARLCAARAVRASVLAVTGPYFRGTVTVPPSAHVGVRVTPYIGPDHSLYAGADAVVAQGGYNTVQELKHNGVRAVTVPGERMLDDQHLRLSALAKRDHVVVSRPDPAEIGERLSELLHLPLVSPAATGPRAAGAVEIAHDIVQSS